MAAEHRQPPTHKTKDSNSPYPRLMFFVPPPWHSGGFCYTSGMQQHYRRKPIIASSEASIAEQLSRYMQLQHPGVLYHFDYGSGARLTYGQAIKQKRLNRRAWPDMFIAAPRHGKAGLFLELKKLGEPVIIKIGEHKGELTQNPHVREQAKTLLALQAEGYDAQFAIGLDAAIEAIRNYLQP